MNKLTIAILAISALFFTACKKKEVADVTVTYKVTLSNPNREFYIRYINETGGTDQEVISTASWTKTFTIKSDVDKVPFELWGACYAEEVPGSSTQYQPQSVTLSIMEDDATIDTKTVSGTSSIYIDSYEDEVYAELPSAVKYTNKK